MREPAIIEEHMFSQDIAGKGLRKGGVSRAVSGIDRRSFIGFWRPTQPYWLPPKASTRAPYHVGVGYSSDSYTAAVDGSGRLRAVSRQPCRADGGDQAQPGGSYAVQLPAPRPIRSGAGHRGSLHRGRGDPDSDRRSCAARKAFELRSVWLYDRFKSYPQVQLVDLRTGTYVLTPVPGGGYAYQAMWVPSLVLQPNTYFISAAKLKTHVDAVVTLSMKNLVGLASETAYAQPVAAGYPRHDLHIAASICRSWILNLVRPIGFAVIDGVWGMEGQGPTQRNAGGHECGAGGPESGGSGSGGAECNGDSPKRRDLSGLCGASGPGAAEYRATSPCWATRTVRTLSSPRSHPRFCGSRWPRQTPSRSRRASRRHHLPIRGSCYTCAAIIQDSDTTPTVVPIRTLHDSGRSRRQERA
jgi:hypothetical protein